MSIPPIRTITLGIADAHPLTAGVIQGAATVLERARERYMEAGYDVQTVRLSTRPVFADLASWSSTALMGYVQELQGWLDDAGLGYCSLGMAQAAHPDFPLERVELIADLLTPASALVATVQLADATHGLREDAALSTAHVMQRLARETEEGFGNFRFAMLACVSPGCPFFPAAYHAGPASLALGLQGAGVIADALRSYGAKQGTYRDLVALGTYVKMVLVEQAIPIVELGQSLAQEHGLSFGGIDLSPAPMGEDSIVAAMELCGYGPVGSPGTLALAAALTFALKNTGLITCGYCGLMLPVLEDAALGRRWEEGKITTHQLLLYSSVCGTGLDTIPLPGESRPEEIARLLLDVAALALRLNKPLSARLFPVPGKKAGERTAFTSPYLTNTLLREL